MQIKIKLKLDDAMEYVLDHPLVDEDSNTRPYLCAEGLDEVFVMQTPKRGYYEKATLVISDYPVKGAAPMRYFNDTDVRVLDRPHIEEQYISMHTRPLLEEMGVDERGKTYWVWVEV